MSMSCAYNDKVPAMAKIYMKPKPYLSFTIIHFHNQDTMWYIILTKGDHKYKLMIM